MTSKLWFLALGVLSACGGNPGSPGVPQIGDLKASLGLDLSKVHGFVVGTSSPPPTGADQSMAKHALYALDESDKLSTVTISTSDEESFVSVYDTLKYVIFEVTGVKRQGKACSLVLSRKADSAMFCSSAKLTHGPPSYTSSALTPLIQADASGEVLFILTEGTSQGGNLLKLDFRDPEHPTESTLFTATADEYAYRLVVNADGDALLALSTGLRIFRADGQVQYLTGRDHTCHARGLTGDEKSFFYWGSDAQALEGIHQLTKQPDGSFSSSLYATTSLTASGGCIFFARTAQRLYVRSVATGGTFIEMVNPENSPRQTTVLNYPTEVLATSTSLLFWGGGESSQITRYQLSDGTQTSLLESNVYRLAKVAVSAGEDVTFSGSLLSSGERVIGTITAGQTTVSNVQANAPVVDQLVRIQ